ncbi:MAG TPA: type I-E CRISPR-associated protein Cse2/CasB [Candidatus Deferrimicrobiaceae bacterium]|jgi:CRISPR system Cascade subunit CasB
MSRFIEWLEKQGERDTKVRAVLRRSLSFPPGAFPSAYPYVEPFLVGLDDGWRREAHYLVAGLWAAHWRSGRSGECVPLARACSSHMKDANSSSTENRFIALLDSDRDQLPYRLRQMVSLLKDRNIDFDNLLKGLLWWNDDKRRTQNEWARSFYRIQANDVADDNESIPDAEATR